LESYKVFFFQCSDEEDNLDEEEEKLAVATTFGLQDVLKVPKVRRRKVNNMKITHIFACRRSPNTL